MRDKIEDVVNDKHRNFVKMILSMEKGINDKSALDKLYNAYMNNDTVTLLHSKSLIIWLRIYDNKGR